MAGKDVGTNKSATLRQEAAAFRAKQRAQARKGTILASIGALAVVAVFAFVVLFIVESGKTSGPYQVYDNGELRAPSAADDSGGILVGPGGVAGAEPDTDAVRIDLYEDPMCPACAVFVEYTTEEIDVLIQSGEIELRFHPLSFLDGKSGGTHYSTRAVNAWATVAEYDPEHFWDFVQVLYAFQPEEGGRGWTNERIEELARDAGVSEAAILKIADGEFTQWVAAATDQASIDVGLRTPTMLIGGVPFESGPHSTTNQLAPGWATPGQIVFAVTYVQENGVEAFAQYLVTPPESASSTVDSL